MTLTEIAYMCLEGVREGHIVDDERLDLRLIYDWIHMKRSQYIKNMRGGSGSQGGNYNPNGMIGANLYQKIPVTVEVTDPVTDAGDYPYSNNTTQSYKIVQSTTTIPAIMDGRSGPMILSIGSKDEFKLPFSYVPYDQMLFAGNGRFNTGLIFGSIRDNKVWFKYNNFFDNYTNVIVRAILENPTDLDGYDKDEDEYPADPGLIEYIKNGIFDKDIRMLFAGQADEINDADGNIKTN